MSRVLAGPWATQALADLGAEVIKVERPALGDETRSFAPFADRPDGTAGESIYFLSTNRGKRSVTIDLATDGGQDLLRSLADKSDVLLENFRCGTMAKFNLSYDELAERNPRLVYCSITGFGQTGAHRFRAGYDLVVQAMGGFMSVTGEPNGQPMKSGVAMADILTGLYATQAILAALLERQTSGLGQYIDLALLDVQIASLANQAASYLMTATVPERHGNAHGSIVPYQDFPTSDGRIVIAVANDLQFVRFARLIGEPQLSSDPLFRTNSSRVQNRLKLLPLIQTRIAERTTREWIAVLDEAKIPAGPINDLEAVFNDSQVVERNLLLEFPSPDGQPIKTVGSPVHYSRTRLSPGVRPPQLGEHTDEILSGLLHKTPEEIQSLRKRQVI